MRIRLHTFATIFALALLAGQVQATPQRWNVDIEGLRLQTASPYDSGTIDRLIDVHGYFTGEDLDQDGIINRQEVLEIDLPGLLIPRYPFDYPYSQGQYGASIIEFSYSPESGLRYKGADLYQEWDFGKMMYWGDKQGQTTIAWLSSTQTRITAVPEASAIGMGIVGLAVAALLMRRRARRITA